MHTAMSKASETTAPLKVIGHGEIDPRELVIDEAANGRAYPTRVDAMAQSLLENGQEQPITVRTLPNGKKSVVFGFQRSRGGLYILENKLQKGFMLRYEEVECTDAEAFLHNIVENKDREGTTVVDDAQNYLKLMGEPFSFTQREIAQRLKVSDALVSRKLTLVRGVKEFPPLSPKILKLGHMGKIAAETMYELVTMTEDARDEYVKRILNGGRVTAADARSNKKKRKGNSEDGGNQGRALTAKAIRLPFEAVVTRWPADKKPTIYVSVCDVMARMCTGALSPTGAMRKIKELVGE